MSDNNMMTMGSHLEVLRRTLFKILGAASLLFIVFFCLKDEVFEFLLAPSRSDFLTFRWLQDFADLFGVDLGLQNAAPVNLISVEMSSQFMNHIFVSAYLALLFTSPYILYQLFLYILPALYENERKFSKIILISIIILFLFGFAINYFVIFPVSCRFLSTYSVSNVIQTSITIDSYVETFIMLSLAMALVFQLPVATLILARAGILNARILQSYRKVAVILILVVSAIITPPDVMTLLLVSLPLYLVYEVSIVVAKAVNRS